MSSESVTVGASVQANANASARASASTGLFEVNIYQRDERGVVVIPLRVGYFDNAAAVKRKALEACPTIDRRRLVYLQLYVLFLSGTHQQRISQTIPDDEYFIQAVHQAEESWTGSIIVILEDSKAFGRHGKNGKVGTSAAAADALLDCLSRWDYRLAAPIEWTGVVPFFTIIDTFSTTSSQLSLSGALFSDLAVHADLQGVLTKQVVSAKGQESLREVHALLLGKTLWLQGLQPSKVQDFDKPLTAVLLSEQSSVRPHASIGHAFILQDTQYEESATFYCKSLKQCRLWVQRITTQIAAGGVGATDENEDGQIQQAELFISSQQLTVSQHELTNLRDNLSLEYCLDHVLTLVMLRRHHALTDALADVLTTPEALATAASTASSGISIYRNSSLTSIDSAAMATNNSEVDESAPLSMPVPAFGSSDQFWSNFTDELSNASPAFATKAATAQNSLRVEYAEVPKPIVNEPDVSKAARFLMNRRFYGSFLHDAQHANMLVKLWNIAELHARTFIKQKLPHAGQVNKTPAEWLNRRDSSISRQAPNFSNVEASLMPSWFPDTTAQAMSWAFSTHSLTSTGIEDRADPFFESLLQYPLLQLNFGKVLVAGSVLCRHFRPQSKPVNASIASDQDGVAGVGPAPLRDRSPSEDIWGTGVEWRRQFAVFGDWFGAGRIYFLDTFTATLACRLHLRLIQELRFARLDLRCIDISDPFGLVWQMKPECADESEERTITRRWMDHIASFCTPTAVIEKIIASGFLQKRGEVNTAYKRRWFVLIGDNHNHFKLRYYQDFPVGAFKGEIDLSQVESVTSLTDKKTTFFFRNNNSGSRTFTLTTNSQAGRIWELMADSVDDAIRWMQQLRSAVAVASSIGSTLSDEDLDDDT